MRALSACVVVLVAAAAATAAPAGAPRVSCSSAVGTPEPAKPGPGDRVLFRSVAVPGAYLAQVERGSGRWAYWRKAGLLVRDRLGAVVRISVPAQFRSKLAVEWGDSGVVSAFWIGRCARGETWNVFTGGFHFAKPGCYALDVSVGAQRTHVPFGLGRRCATRAS